jgi:predicted CoA-substrate-specific enzyme activase
MLVAGLDIGAATTKAVILNDSEMIAYSVIPTGHNIAQAVNSVIHHTLEKTENSFNNLQYIVSTGYGRRAVPFAQKKVTEIICHAIGVHSIIPEARTIIDIGGQDSKVISLDNEGHVINFVMNDKCAAGTGRFLEVIAGVLDLKIYELGLISKTSKNPCEITSTCTVFAESEIVALRADGRSREDLIAGLHKALSHRIVIMGKPIGFLEKVVLTGGVAKNIGIKKAFEEEIGLKIEIPENPQITGALGAAILARRGLH